MSVPGPTPLTPQTVDLLPQPCDESDALKNWARMSQIPMILQNQITGRGGIKNIIDLLNSLTLGDTTTLDTFVTNLLTAITNNLININTTILDEFTTYILDRVMSSVTYQTNYRYDTSSHKFQKKTQQAYVFNPAAESDWIDVYTAVGVVDVTNVDYVSHALRQTKTNTDRYVLEGGTTATTNILSAVAITPAKAVTWVAPTLAYDQYAAVYVFEAGAAGSITVDTADAATCS